MARGPAPEARRGGALSRRPAAALALIGALLAGLLTACAPVAPEPAAEPAVGECRLLDRPEQFAVLSDASPGLDCAEPHTAETYHVGDLDETEPEGAAYPSLGEREAIAGEACPPRLVRAYLAANDRQALYGVWTVPFLPDPEQWADGERWVRCDLVTVADETGAFDPVLHEVSLLRAAADGTSADALTRCYAVTGEVRDPLLVQAEEVDDVRCDQPHQYRDVNDWSPLEQQLETHQVLARCGEAVQTWNRLGLAPAGGTAGVLRAEANGNLTLRCAVVESAVGG